AGGTRARRSGAAARRCPGPAAAERVRFRHGKQTWALPFVRREFTVEIVELCQREDRPTGPAARDGGLIETAHQAWAKQTEPDAATGDDGGLTTAERRGLAGVGRGNRRLRGGGGILKRAVGNFGPSAR